MKFMPSVGDAILVGLARSTEPPVMSRVLTVLDPNRFQRLLRQIRRNRFEELQGGHRAMRQ